VIGINNPAKKTPLRQLRSRKACGSYSLEYPLVKNDEPDGDSHGDA
jgi:hypothetical protein